MIPDDLCFTGFDRFKFLHPESLEVSSKIQKNENKFDIKMYKF